MARPLHSTRRILLCSAQSEGLGNLAGGYRVSAWVGRVDWCQPRQFGSRADLDWHLERRLALAGLACVGAWPVVPLDGQWHEIRVTVRRMGSKPFRKRAGTWITLKQLDA